MVLFTDSPPPSPCDYTLVHFKHAVSDKQVMDQYQVAGWRELCEYLAIVPKEFTDGCWIAALGSEHVRFPNQCVTRSPGSSIDTNTRGKFLPHWFFLIRVPQGPS
jgi:hypothetical protein